MTKTLLSGISHREFEEFTADLLRTLGYQTRATPYSTDGGVDVIAHRDPLGLEPPIIKVSASTRQRVRGVRRCSNSLERYPAPN